MESETVVLSFVFQAINCSHIINRAAVTRALFTSCSIASSQRFTSSTKRFSTIRSPSTMSRSTDWIPGLWLDTFNDLLYDDNELDYGDQWTLNFNYSQTDQVTKEERKKGWKVYCCRAFGDFKCASCSKTWPSARVVVLFRYRLRSDRGTVIMRPFGQACRSCKNNMFELPGFSDKEVEQALVRLFSKIRKNIYGEDDDDDGGSSASSNKVWTKPHEKTLCQACIMGICTQDND
uniref:Receptor-transporting protein 4-like n=2 Tax=Seriola dumerili TaxID=41447 RepID=A0A3B4U9V7_SERDU